MKFKRYKYAIDVTQKFNGDGIDLEMKSGFILQAVPVNKEQALKIAKILYPEMIIDSIEIRNIAEDKNETCTK